ncbi:MAG: hypothetical protein AAGU73_01120 [Actinomycetota bacterium]
MGEATAKLFAEAGAKVVVADYMRSSARRSPMRSTNRAAPRRRRAACVRRT